MKTAAIYCRVSTSDQADNGTSLDTQAQACQKYAETNGYKVLEVFKEARSGASLNRPMLDQVRELARSGAIQAVLFYALDRLSRDDTDTLLLAKEWRNHDVELKCATTPLEDTPQGQFLLTMLAAVGKLERAGILERTMRGKRQSIKNGKTGCGPCAPFGYDYITRSDVLENSGNPAWAADGRQAGALVINEAEAVVVRSMFNWYTVEGISLSQISARLMQRGVRSKYGGVWEPATVRRVLRYEGNAGQLWWGKTVQRNGKRITRPREEWIGPVAVPAIVSRPVFERAQARFERNARMSPRRSEIEYLLRSRFYCSECGRRLVGRSRMIRANRIGHYVCSGLTKLDTNHCNSRSFGRDRAEREVWDWVIEHLSNPDLIMRLVEQPGEAQRRQRERDDADLRALLGVRADCQKAEDRDLDAHAAGGMALDKLLARKKTRDERLQEVEAAIALIEERQAQQQRARQNLIEVSRLCEAVQGKLPAAAAQMTCKQRQDVLEVMQVRAVGNQDGTITVSALLTEDILDLLAPRDATLDNSRDGVRYPDGNHALAVPFSGVVGLAA